MKHEDLSNKKFGYLTAISRCDDHVSKSGIKSVRWLCICDCGNYKKVVARKLKTNHTKSCGKCNKFSNFIDLTGQKIDKLFVIKLHGYTLLKNGDKDYKYECLCDCGGTVIMTGRSLRDGKFKHGCGCYKSEIRILDKDMVGKSFNKLIVLERSSIDREYWVCKCVCGSKVEVHGSSLRNGHTGSCGCYRLEMIANSHYTSLSEELLIDYFKQESIPYKKQKTFSGLKSPLGNLLSYDFYIQHRGLNILIECNGEQHYKPVDFFGGLSGFEKQKLHDNIKRTYAKNNGYMLIELDCRPKNKKNILRDLLEYLNI